MRPILVILNVAAIVLLMLGCAPAMPSERECVTIEGVQVCAPFLGHYEAWGGQAVLGAPISGVIMEQSRHVQYFENVCLEADPFSGSVKLTNLGDLMGYRTAPLSPETGQARQDNGATWYPQTGHTLCPAFEDYYQQMGGPERLGYPIAEFGLEGDLIVQHFERARLEWHPADGLDAVRLGPLGVEHWRQLMAGRHQPQGESNELGDTSRAQDLSVPKGTPFMPEPTLVPLPLSLDISVAADVATCPGEQTVMLRARDAEGVGVPGLAGTITVHERNSDRVLQVHSTDEQGFAVVSYALDPVSRGYSVLVDAELICQNQSYIVRTHYVVW